MDKFISTLLDQLQHKKDNAENDYQIKILNRLIALLETYIK